MLQNRQWQWRTLGIVALAMVLGGCQGQGKANSESLASQNRELQERLTQTQGALDLAMEENGRLADEISRLNGELEAARNRTGSTPTPIVGANTGFSDIDGVETIRGAGTITVRVPGDVLFASGKVDLRSQALRTLDQIADVIKREHNGQIVRIEGYTDTDPITRSKWTDNLELSAHRAMAVHRHLAKRGLDASRMYAAGFGAAKPRSTKEKSRRVEIVVVLNE